MSFYSFQASRVIQIWGGGMEGQRERERERMRKIKEGKKEKKNKRKGKYCGMQLLRYLIR